MRWYAVALDPHTRCVGFAVRRLPRGFHISLSFWAASLSVSQGDDFGEWGWCMVALIYSRGFRGSDGSPFDALFVAYLGRERLLERG